MYMCAHYIKLHFIQYMYMYAHSIDYCLLLFAALYIYTYIHILLEDLPSGSSMF